MAEDRDARGDEAAGDVVSLRVEMDNLTAALYLICRAVPGGVAVLTAHTAAISKLLRLIH